MFSSHKIIKLIRNIMNIEDANIAFLLEPSNAIYCKVIIVTSNIITLVTDIILNLKYDVLSNILLS